MGSRVEGPYRYDVAFSFRAPDLKLAEELEGLLAGLQVFVYSRRKEELLGGDGMDRFASVFGQETRLAVILYRDGWGKTPWTGFEESHIKGRALLTNHKSYMLVRLDHA